MRFRIALINSCMAMQIYFGAVSDNLLIDYLYCIAGNFRKKKTFADCLLVPPKDATCSNFAKKTFANKPQNLQVFSLESFPLYGRKLRYQLFHTSVCLLVCL